MLIGVVFCVFVVVVEVEFFMWNGIECVVVIGDVYGYYGELFFLFEGMEIVLVDDEGILCWLGGKVYFVFLGDFIDCGLVDCDVFDLV